MVDRATNRFHVKLIERRVNEALGGDATIGELVNVMIEMGWQPPHRATTDVWRPIETAPHTETIIGYYAPTRGMIMAHWFPAEEGAEAGFFTEEECQGPCNLTHWRPLPPPPEADHG